MQRVNQNQWYFVDFDSYSFASTYKQSVYRIETLVETLQKPATNLFYFCM